MATISILSPKLHKTTIMSTRRVPLGANSNAVNSPMRTNAAAPVGKHQAKRSIAIVQQENQDASAPPAKKHIIEAKVERNIRTPPRQTASSTFDGQAMGRRAYAQSNVFERRVEAVRRRPVSQAQARADRLADKASEENLETIRQWQKHYKRVFPKFVFYFESVPEESRGRLIKQVTSLGAVCYFLHHSETVLLTFNRLRRSSSPTLLPTS